MSGDLYLRLTKAKQVNQMDVTIGDIAELEWENKTGLAKICSTKVFSFQKKKHTRCVVSALYLVHRIHELYPGVTVNLIGEADVVVELQSNRRNHPVCMGIKIVFVSILAFIGAAFAIMSFNNDVTIQRLFSHVHAFITGKKEGSSLLLEVCYSIGLAIGILLFFNHFKTRKNANDPTPMEVQMRLYEQDISTTLTESADEQGIHYVLGK